MWNHDKVRELQQLLEGEDYPPAQARLIAAQWMVYKGDKMVELAIEKMRAAKLYREQPKFQARLLPQ
jgi:hypothetical protein